MILFTSGDWHVDEAKEITHAVGKFMEEQFNQLVNETVEVNQVDLGDEFAYGFCQQDGDEHLIHIHNGLSIKDYVTTLIHELVHVRQNVQGLKDNEMRESEAYFWERLLSKQFWDSSESVHYSPQKG